MSLTVHEGEVLGLAGLEGAGRTEVLECIFGVRHIDSGAIYMNGQPVKINTPMSAKLHNIAYMTKDRKEKGLFLTKAIFENMLAANFDRFTKNGLVRPEGAVKDAETYKEAFDLKTPDV